MAWKSMVTTQGLALEARSINNIFTITGAKCGSGTSDISDLISQTDVINPIKSMQITQIGTSGNHANVRVQLTNEGINSNTHVNQIGLWAKIDGDPADVLYMIFQTDTPELVPSAGNSPGWVKDYLHNITIANAESVTAVVDSAAYITIDMLKPPQLKGYATVAKQSLLGANEYTVDYLIYPNDDPASVINTALQRHKRVFLLDDEYLIKSQITVSSECELTGNRAVIKRNFTGGQMVKLENGMLRNLTIDGNSETFPQTNNVGVFGDYGQILECMFRNHSGGCIKLQRAKIENIEIYDSGLMAIGTDSGGDKTGTNISNVRLYGTNKGFIFNSFGGFLSNVFSMSSMETVTISGAYCTICELSFIETPITLESFSDSNASGMRTTGNLAINNSFHLTMSAVRVDTLSETALKIENCDRAISISNSIFKGSSKSVQIFGTKLVDFNGVFVKYPIEIDGNSSNIFQTSVHESILI